MSIPRICISLYISRLTMVLSIVSSRLRLGEWESIYQKSLLRGTFHSGWRTDMLGDDFAWRFWYCIFFYSSSSPSYTISCLFSMIAWVRPSMGRRNYFNL